MIEKIVNEDKSKYGNAPIIIVNEDESKNNGRNLRPTRYATANIFILKERTSKNPIAVNQFKVNMVRLTVECEN